MRERKCENWAITKHFGCVLAGLLSSSWLWCLVVLPILPCTDGTRPGEEGGLPGEKSDYAPKQMELEKVFIIGKITNYTLSVVKDLSTDEAANVNYLVSLSMNKRQWTY